MTHSYPFVHYQVHEIDVQGGLFGEYHQTFIPVDRNTCIFQSDNEEPISAIVYNIYLYTEDDILVESFAHKFRQKPHIEGHFMTGHTGPLLVIRSVSDIFHRATRLSGKTKSLPVWQFAESV